ncbi:MAG: response regulator, partial [Desulfobacterales bacterium]|nr:response regulator [Desulfobacterales bacterium]
MENHILIVDDEIAITDSMCEFIETAGYKGVIACSAEDALALLREQAFDVVITDITLPGMDGLALTDFIKKNYDAEVIVMTGYSADYSYAEAVSKGASDFVFKPVRFDELLLRLKRVIREREYTHERDRMLKKLETLAITDGLTRLFNSRHFYYQLEVEAGRALRYNHALSLLLLDID